MSVPQLLLALFTVFLLSVGQVLLKLAADTIDVSATGLISALMNLRLIAAVLVYIIATALWLVAIRGIPLNIAYPIAAFAFFIVPTLSHFILGEALGWHTYAGAGIIALGVVVSVAR